MIRRIPYTFWWFFKLKTVWLWVVFSIFILNLLKNGVCVRSLTRLEGVSSIIPFGQWFLSLKNLLLVRTHQIRRINQKTFFPSTQTRDLVERGTRDLSFTGRHIKDAPNQSAMLPTYSFVTVSVMMKAIHVWFYDLYLHELKMNLRCICGSNMTYMVVMECTHRCIGNNSLDKHK